MKKTVIDFIEVLKAAENKKIPASTRNKTKFKLHALKIYFLMVKINSDPKKKKLSKRNLCIYIAEHNDSFKNLYTKYKSKTYPPADKWIDKKTTARGQIGLDFYHNIICDKRKNWEMPFAFKYLFEGNSFTVTEYKKGIKKVHQVQVSKYFPS
jgi:hypothetical protein|tara:strand:- start:246 stop:704 length:459 start_codon:yes stop_codon:yes gene_type:complete